MCEEQLQVSNIHPPALSNGVEERELVGRRHGRRQFFAILRGG